jgi:hypothetical protein
MLPNSQTMMRKRARGISLPIKTARYAFVEARAPSSAVAAPVNDAPASFHAFLVTNVHTSIPGNGRFWYNRGGRLYVPHHCCTRRLSTVIAERK